MPKIFVHLNDDPDATEEECAAIAQAVSARPSIQAGDEITVGDKTYRITRVDTRLKSDTTH
jgi:hypothetical protein